MAKRGPTNVFHFSVDRDLAAQIHEYHRSLEAAGLAGSMPDTLRELIRLGLSAVPYDEAILQARVRAWNTSRHWIMTTLSNLINDVQKQVESELSLEVLRGHQG